MVPITLHSKVLSWLEASIFDTDARLPDHIESVLADFFGQREAFRHDLQTISEPLFETMLLQSRETPSHFKWHLLTLHDGSRECLASRIQAVFRSFQRLCAERS